MHLRYPTRHRRRWRSTNLLERSHAEVKRRTKVIGRFPRETSCLTLVWAVLDLYITHAKNGVRFSQLERQPPTPHQTPRKRTNNRPGGDRRLHSPTGNPSRGEFTAAKRRHPWRGRACAIAQSGSELKQSMSDGGGSPCIDDAATVALADDKPRWCGSRSWWEAVDDSIRTAG